MLYSKLFGKTIKQIPADAVAASHQLLIKAGYIRESTAGRYYFLPLGLQVQHKIMAVIKEEMDKAGAQELVTPVLHPLSLWQETNRDKSTGYELMTVKDRRDFPFALGGTAEEMVIDLVRKFQISYKDMPFNLYQFSSKFRDELRSRGGLLRVREFVMKDAYSFNLGEEDFQKEYDNMARTYTRIFDRLGLKTHIVESDNGYIGGDYCHEFIVESPIGESRYLVTEDGQYAAHEDVAKFKKEIKNAGEEMLPMKEVDAVRGTTMEDGAKLHGKPLWLQIKDVLFVDETGRFVLAIIRGDYDVNEIKLKHLTGALTLRHATDEEIRRIMHSEPGFISPVGIKETADSKARILIVADDSLHTIANAYGGANKKNRDLFNMNIGRDYKADLEGDIALAKEGYLSESGKILIAKKGIEVGNIFQLGYYYSKRMKGAVYIDKDGKEKPYYMGCYGIGIGRTMAAVAEIYHDARGLTWPEIITPYKVHLIGLNLDDQTVSQSASSLYRQLAADYRLPVLYDDRQNVSPGEKFADADLIGIPIRLVVSKKTAGKIEFKKRSEKTSQLVTVEELMKLLA